MVFIHNNVPVHYKIHLGVIITIFFFSGTYKNSHTYVQTRSSAKKSYNIIITFGTAQNIVFFFFLRSRQSAYGQRFRNPDGQTKDNNFRNYIFKTACNVTTEEKKKNPNSIPQYGVTTIAILWVAEKYNFFFFFFVRSKPYRYHRKYPDASDKS